MDTSRIIFASAPSGTTENFGNLKFRFQMNNTQKNGMMIRIKSTAILQLSLPQTSDKTTYGTMTISPYNNRKIGRFPVFSTNQEQGKKYHPQQDQQKFRIEIDLAASIMFIQLIPTKIIDVDKTQDVRR